MSENGKEVQRLLVRFLRFH